MAKRPTLPKLDHSDVPTNSLTTLATYPACLPTALTEKTPTKHVSPRRHTPTSPPGACTRGTPHAPALFKTVNSSHSSITPTIPPICPVLLESSPTLPDTNSKNFPGNNAPTHQSDDRLAAATLTAQPTDHFQSQVHPNGFLKDIDWPSPNRPHLLAAANSSPLRVISG